MAKFYNSQWNFIGMDKILQFLQLLLILEVVSSRECYLRNLPEKWCNKEMKILFDESQKWETFNCSNQDCGSKIMFFNNDEFKQYLTEEISNNSITELFVYENHKIQKDETKNLQDNLPEENLALIEMGNDSLVIRNQSNNVYLTSVGYSDNGNYWYFAVIDNNKQYIIKESQGPDEFWQLINVGTQNNEYLQIGQLGSTVVLMSDTHLYELGDSLKDICIARRNSNTCKSSCSKPALRGTVDPKTFIREGRTYINTTINLKDSRVFMFPEKGCSEQQEMKNIISQTSIFIPKWKKAEDVLFVIKNLTDGITTMTFSYKENPEITNISSKDFYNWTNYTRNCTTNNVDHVCNESGKPLVFQGNYFNNVKSVSVTPDGLFTCTRGATDIQCNMISYEGSGKAVLNLDTYKEPFSYTLHDEPVFEKVNIFKKDLKNLEIFGKRMNSSATTDDYKITVNKEPCSLTSLNHDNLRCQLNASIEMKLPYDVKIILQQRMFSLKYKEESNLILRIVIPVIGALIGVLTLVIICFVFMKCVKKQKAEYDIDMPITMGIYKEPDFVGQKKNNDVAEIDVPFQKMTQYIEQILLIDKPRGYKKNPGGKKLPFDIQEKLGHFEVLLKNKFFILNVIKAMERKKNICHNENYELSLHLCLLLSFNLGFLRELCEELFKDLIHHTKEKEKKRIMSRFDSIAESIIKNWLALSMYPYIKFKFEPLLYNFVNEVRQFLTQGPVDEVTGSSQHYFFKSCSISKPIEYKKINVQLIYTGRFVRVPILSCDSISQLKTKCLVAYQAENISCVLLNPEDIQIVYRGSILSEYTEEVDSNGYSLMATVNMYSIKDGDQLHFKKVAKPATSDIETRYVTLGASVSVVSKKVNKSYHLVAGDKRKALSMTDISHMKLPTELEALLLNLFSKVLDQAYTAPPLRYLHNFFIHQASKFSLDAGSQWTINSFVIQMCSQFISHPNILLDIPIDLCVQKNLSAIQLYIKEALLRPKSISSKTCQVGKQIYAMVSRFITQLNEQPELDKSIVIKSLQEASALYTNGITIYKEISLYSLLRIMENNYVVVYKALESNDTARKLCLHEKFSNIFH
ncbi:plexin-B2-like isoform X2 [Octopus sinensis]|uniref:Plexin-B2-like isoform X2 n=1 Tax=Octopus sinensis TaxID=2607531 RepID=A0A6P7T753_9MOLL|nr:plexin-B2-like isoform X2 [Octopus sinensis]